MLRAGRERNSRSLDRGQRPDDRVVVTIAWLQGVRESSSTMSGSPSDWLPSWARDFARAVFPCPYFAERPYGS